MSNYNGTKCISCGENFKDNDDVVVCPVCGTPYHRECYIKEGECINTDLHENGESWKPEYEQNRTSSEQSAEPVKCIRCGAENPPQGLFCSKCGMPLSGNGDGERPFNNVNTNENSNANKEFNQQFQNNFNFNGFNTVVLDKDSEVDGVKLDDYARYVGKNPLSFLANFIRFGKNGGGKVSMNLGALIFPEIYFFYRKMPLLGVLFMLATTLLSIPSIIYLGQEGLYGMVLLNTNINVNSSDFVMMSNLCSYLSMGISILAGLFASYWYYKKAKADIKSIRGKYDGKADEGQIKQVISEKGGTSWVAVIVAVTANFVLMTALIVAINFLFA